MINRDNVVAFAAGTVVAVAVIFALGAAADISEPQIGRFQIEKDGNHAYVIDTATGEVWQQHALPSRGSNSTGFSEPKLK